MKSDPKSGVFRLLITVLCIFAISPGDTLAYSFSQTSAPSAPPGKPAPTSQSPPPSQAFPSSQAASTSQPATAGQAAKIPPDQLDSLVAPIALYPDPLLAQTLAASTYPLEIVQLQQWLAKNKTLKDKALADAVAKQPWDPSVQALAPLPDVVKRLGENISWTTDLGNAFLAQETDVMDAVQRMRMKAQEKGTLKTTEQQKVETKVIEKKTVVVVEPSSPEVIYVPSYDPMVVYGAGFYPYPPLYYPPVGAMAVSFGVGVMMGAIWSGGGWGWNCGWGGHNNIYINNNNNFNRNTNISNRSGNFSGNRPSTQPSNGMSNWSHNPEHRGGAPYSDRGTADRFGGTTRGDSLANRQASAKQQLGRQASSPGGMQNFGTRSGGAGVSNRASGSGGASLGGGSDRIGSRDVSRGSGAGNRDAFSGGSKGFSGASARASSSRGASSMSRSSGSFSRGSGGFSRGGGGRRR